MSSSVVGGLAKIVERLHDFGAVASYNELRLFRSSAAVERNKEFLQVMTSDSLIQVVADNFDCNISSQIGLKQTHSLAMIVIQDANPNDNKIKERTFPRLKNSRLSDDALENVSIDQYHAPKKPEMP